MAIKFDYKLLKSINTLIDLRLTKCQRQSENLLADGICEIIFTSSSSQQQIDDLVIEITGLGASIYTVYQ